MTFPIPLNLSSFPSPARQVVSSKKLTRPLVMKNNKSPAGKGTITVSRPSERVLFFAARVLRAPLTGRRSPQISAEEINDNRVVNFEVEARKLDNKVRPGGKVGVGWRLFSGAATFSPNLRFSQDFFGKSDPYLEFYKQTATGWQLAHRTEVNPLRRIEKTLFKPPPQKKKNCGALQQQ